MTLKNIKNAIFNIVVAGSVLTTVSNASNVPILSVSKVDKSTPSAPVVTLNWATEIPTSKMLWKYTFESSEHANVDLVYNANNGKGTGGQKFDTSQKYAGSYSVYSPTTLPANGNWVIPPDLTPKNENHIWFRNKTIKLANGTPLSISYRIKTTDSTRVRVTGNWVYENRRVNTGATFAQSYSSGATNLKVSDASKFYYDEKITLNTSATSTSNIHNVRGIDKTNNTITIYPGLSKAVTKGDIIYEKPHIWMFKDAFNTINTNNAWQLVNINTTINDSNYIDWIQNPQPLRMGIVSNGKTWIDELKVGKATKVRVYRGTTKIYDGYASEFKDTGVKDTVKPNKVTGITASISKDGNDTTKKKITFKYANATDANSIFKYTAKSLDDSGKEGTASKEVSANVKSDILGYSYVIDKSSSTIPNAIANTSSTTITKSISNTDNSTYYLHIRAIDKAGNAGDTTHFKVLPINPPELALDAINVSKPTAPTVKLSWKTELHPDNIFWDTGFESSDQANIDLVYSSTNGLGTSGQKFDSSTKYSGSYAYYTPTSEPDKGNWVSSTSSVSNMNHVWFRGKTLTVQNGEQISISYMLKNTESSRIRIAGDWQYEHKNVSTGAKLAQAATKGSTVLKLNTVSGFNTQTFITFSSDPSNHDYMRQVVAIDTTNKTITLHTGIPNNVASGTTLYKKSRIYQFEQDTTYRNTNGKWELVNYYTKVPDNYVLDWSKYPSELRMNVHAKSPLWIDELQVGLASEAHIYRDGTKIATGMYEGVYTDSTATDKAKPNAVEEMAYSITENTTNSTKKISISYSAVEDNGTDYKYTAKALNKNKAESGFSNQIIANVKTGIKGYSYVIDRNPSTIPDSTIETSGVSFSHTIPIDDNEDYYLHILSVDKAGNTSDVKHYEIEVEDTMEPELNVVVNPTLPTSGNVNIKVTATDKSGISYIELPTGEKVYSNTTTYTVDKNGYYSFIAVDKYGNMASIGVEITNIDKNKPIISFNKNPDMEWSTTDVDVSIVSPELEDKKE